MDGKDSLTNIGHFTVNLIEHTAGGLGGGRDGRAHSFQTVVKFVSADFSGIDLAFWKLDLQGCLDDSQRFQFFGGQVSGAIGNYFHQGLTFKKRLIFR